jgi:Domain of unknown function (DUF5615)
MKIRFQADADFNQIILRAVLRREPSIDFLTAEMMNLAGLTDPEVLAVAAGAGRVLVSHDQKTMPRHFAEFIARTRSPGLLLVPQSFPIAAAMEDILLIWFASEAEEWVNRIRYLPL